MVRLVWTDEQRKWLHDHIARVEGYRQSTPFKDRQAIYTREVNALRAVQQAIPASRPTSGAVAVWEWWAYWYSASWLNTHFSPSPQHAEQLEDSMAFRLERLLEREAQLHALKHPTP
jgi:hypothetical protein